MRPEETKLKKAKNWLEDRWFFVALILLFIVYMAVSKIVHTTKKNIEILGKGNTEQSIENDPTITDKKINHFKIVGNIVNEQDDPISHAKITVLQEPTLSDHSDSEGNFILSLDSLNDVAEIKISHSRYQSYTKKILTADYSTGRIDLNKIVLNARPKPPTEKKETPVPKEKTTNKIVNSPNSIIVSDTKGDVKINQKNEKN